MADANEKTSPDETRFDEVLGDYLRRVDAGELLDPEQFIAQHDDVADRLRTYFATAEELEQLAGPATGKASGTPETDNPAPPVQETIPPTGADIGSSLLRPGSSSQSLPDEFGRYRVERMLGAGAMGSVYLAHDTELDRNVALKVPKFDDDEPEMMERFYREARSAAKIHHRNICPVFDVGEIGGLRYISMAYIEGLPLSDYISADKRQSEREVAMLVRKLALALVEAHDQGVIHRDLKPANVMVDRHGEPVIMDFGLARQINTKKQSRLTQTGTIMGTPTYMSPEQVDGDTQRIGPVSDVYSLGVMFYELLTARPPFEGSLTSVLAQIVTKEPAPPSEFRHDLNPRLEAICLKMMAKQIPDRYQSMAEAAEALTRFLKRKPADPLVEAAAKQKAAKSASAQQAVPATDAPADQPDPLLKRLQEQREKVKDLAGRFQIPAAVQILEKITHETDPRCQKYVDWAAKEIKRLKTLPGKYRKQIPDMMEAAHKLIAAHDYAQAAALLQDFPDPFRTDEIQELLDQTIELQDEVDLLIADIDDAVQHKQFEGLLPNVERLLELQPGRKKTRELYEDLTGYGPRTRFRGSRSLAGKRYQEGPWSLFSPRLLVMLFLTLAGIISLVYAGVTIYAKTGKGTLQITLHDKTVHLSLDGESLKIENLGQPIKVRATDHELIVERDGLETKTKRFTLKRGEKLAVEVAVVNGKLAIVTGGEKLPQSRDSHAPGTEPGRAAPDQTGSVADHPPGTEPGPATPPATGSPKSFGNSPWTITAAGRLEGHTDVISHMVISPDGQQLVSVQLGSEPGRRWDLTTGRQLPISVPLYHNGIFLSNSQMLFSGGTLQRYDLTGQKTLWTTPLPAFFHAVAVTPDRTIALAGNFTSPFLYVFDFRTGVQLRKIDLGAKVMHIAIHPEGKTTWIACKNEVLVLDLETWKVTEWLKGLPGANWRQPHFSADGSSIIIGSPNSREIWLWDVKTKKVIREFKGHTSVIRALSFLPGDQQFVSGSYDRSLRLWDVASGKQLAIVSAKTSRFNLLAVTPDGKYVYSAGGSQIVRENDYAIYKWRIGKPGDQPEPPSGGSPPPTGSTRAGSEVTPGSPTDILTSDKWKWTTPVNLGPVINSSKQWQGGATLSADGLTLIFGSSRARGRGEVDLWISKRSRADAPWGKPVNLGPNVNSKDWEGDPNLSADGLTLLSGASIKPKSEGYAYGIWMSRRASRDAPWGKRVKLGAEINSNGTCRYPSLSADGLTLIFGAVRQDGFGRLDLWMSRRSSTDAPWSEAVKLGPNINSKEIDGDPALSADGLTLVFMSGPLKPPNQLHLWMSTRPRSDAPWGPRVQLGSGINSNGDSRWPALSADGRTLIFQSRRPGGFGTADLWMSRRVPANGPATGTGSTRAGSVLLVDGPPGEVGRLAGHTKVVLSVAFSPDGGRIASAGDGVTGSLLIHDARTGRLLRTLDGHTAGCFDVVFSSDGRRLASASGDKTVKLWDAETGKVLRTFTGHADKVLSVAISPDGTQLASGSLDKTIRLWDAETGKMLRTLQGHTRPVRCLAFSPDGKRLVSGGDDKLVRLWSTTTGRTLHRLTGHTARVVSVAFSPDGKAIASGGGNMTVRLWNAKTGRTLGRITGHTGGVTTVAFLTGGRYLLTSAQDKTVRLWNLKNGAEVYRFTAATYATNCAAVSADGRFAVSAGGVRWDPRQKKLVYDGDYSLHLWRLPKQVWRKQPRASK